VGAIEGLAAVALAALLASLGGAPAWAQGAFDMGILTNTISQDAVRQSEERRARESRPRQRASSSDPSSERTKANCAKARGWAAEGRKFAELPRALELCGRLGY
jgi:hypothetical protein